MSRTDIAYADAAAALVHDVSAANVRSLRSLRGMSAAERRENLLAIARALLAAPAWFAKPENKAAAKTIVRYHALTPDPWPAFGRLLVAVRDCDAVEVDRALDRLVAVGE